MAAREFWRQVWHEFTGTAAWRRETRALAEQVKRDTIAVVREDIARQIETAEHWSTTYEAPRAWAARIARGHTTH